MKKFFSPMHLRVGGVNSSMQLPCKFAGGRILGTPTPGNRFLFKTVPDHLFFSYEQRLTLDVNECTDSW